MAAIVHALSLMGVPYVDAEPAGHVLAVALAVVPLFIVIWRALKHESHAARAAGEPDEANWKSPTLWEG